MPNLALKYRPARFSELTGQRPVWLVLRKMVQLGQVPTSILLTGSPGCGKTSTGRILAAALNCEGQAEPGEPCGTCASCVAVADGTALSVTEIDAASNGLVSDVRKLREACLYDHGGRWHVVLLDEAHSMSRDAFNALLHLMEEPPERTMFVLLTTEVRKILPAVASRCMSFQIRRIPVSDIVTRLETICKTEWPGDYIEPALLADIAERAAGGMRNAVMYLDQCRSVGINTLRQYQNMTGDSDFGPLLVSAMADGDTRVLFGHVDRLVCESGDFGLIEARIVGTLRDVLVLGAGGSVTAQGASLAARKALVSRLDAQRVTAAMRVLWEMRTKLHPGSDPRSSLDLAAVMCLEQLKPKVSPNGVNGNKAPNGVPASLSIAEMQRLAQVGLE